MTNPATGSTAAPVAGGGEPQFATVMRGFDRGQVEDYVARLGDFLADAERRAERAEHALRDQVRHNDEMREAMAGRGSDAQPYDGLGKRIQSMLSLAAEEAAEIREAAQEEAERTIADARRQRESEISEAQHNLADVTARRDTVVEELRKVQDALATLGLRQQVAASADAATPSDDNANDSADDSADDDPDDDLGADATRVITLPATAAAGQPG